MASLFGDDSENEIDQMLNDQSHDPDDLFLGGNEDPEPAYKFRNKVDNCEESDEDLKLFTQKDKEGDEGQYGQAIQKVIGLAKRRIQRQVDIEERRNRRLVKIQEYYFAKSYLVLQIGRCLKISSRNFGPCKNLIIGQLLSFKYNVKKRSFGQNDKLKGVKSLLYAFNKSLKHKLEYDLECEVRPDYKICHALASDAGKLNRIEYMQLFNILLQHLGYKTRFLCAFETKSLEELGLINAVRTNKSKKIGKGNSFKENMLKKRKRTAFDAFKEDSEKEIHPTLSKIAKLQDEEKWNEERKLTKESQLKSSLKSMNFLEKFAFDSSQEAQQKQLTKESLNKGSIQNRFLKAKKEANPPRRKRKVKQSNLFVTELDVEQSGSEPDDNNDKNSAQKAESPSQSHKNKTKELEESKASKEAIDILMSSDDEKPNSKFDYTLGKTKYDLMNDYCCLEVLNTETKKWVIVDLFNETLIHSKLVMSNYIDEKSILFLFALGRYKYYTYKQKEGPANRNSLMKSSKKMTQMYMKDVTLKYCSYFQQMLAAKNSLYIQDKIIEEIDLIAPYFENACADKYLRKVMRIEDKDIYNLERYYIPEKYSGFRSHKHFVLESLLGKYQFIMPNAEPLSTAKYRDEPIYHRKDVVHLHTREQWRRLKRDVLPSAKYIKKIKGNYNDKDKMALLYGYWQTKQFENVLNPDGSLPQNEYGNIEIFHEGAVPKGATHLRIKKGRIICKKLDIDYKEAMVGFESGTNGMSYPVIDGVIVLDQDVQKVRDMHDKMEADREARELKKRKHEAKTTWRQLIKKVCVKRYTAKLFEKTPEERADDVPMTFK